MTQRLPVGTRLGRAFHSGTRRATVVRRHPSPDMVVVMYDGLDIIYIMRAEWFSLVSVPRGWRIVRARRGKR